ncbi:MAG: hypothetical protein RRX93_07455 [Bacteroidales bacterium]
MKKSFSRCSKTSVLFLLLLLIAGFLYFIPRHTISEEIRKGAAKLLTKEYIPNQHIALEKTEAFLKKDSVYALLRKKNFRFHSQGFFTLAFSDSSRLFIWCEPPNATTIDSLKKIGKQFNFSIELRTHKIGVDGYGKDLLLTFANATTENISNIAKRISFYIYGTDYKAVLQPISAGYSKIYFSKNNLDYQINLSDLNRWFLEDKETFITLLDTTKSYTVSDLMLRKKAGLFFSSQPGFVAWVLPRKTDLKKEIPIIRQFSLDADLILGGFSDTATLVIIGREREASLNELPPLRVETILLLASITQKELSQSLDINDLMAGKMPNGQDWCPTYLSRELENTELGHLLTITDILLKDWSEKGSIQESYYRYPKPGYYPFDQPLFRKLGLNELVYNWNTAETMYAIEQRGKTIYALNRTGALPVSYFNSQQNYSSIGSSYENKAYNYFAGLNCPDLVRVVQYTSLYQIFIDNNIHYSGPTYAAFPSKKPHLLEKATELFLSTIKNTSSLKMEQIAERVAEDYFENYQKSKIITQINNYEKEKGFNYSSGDRDKILRQVKLEQLNRIRSAMFQAQEQIASLSEENFKKLVRYLAYPRGLKIKEEASYNLMMQGRAILDFAQILGKQNYVYFGMDLSKVKQEYIKNLSYSAAKYLKSASVIITFNDFETTGGHNISSKINRVSSMSGYRKSHSNSTSGSNLPKSQKPSSSKAPEAKSPQKSLYRNSSQNSTSNTNRTSTLTTQGRVRSSVISSQNRDHRGL